MFTRLFTHELRRRRRFHSLHRCPIVATPLIRPPTVGAVVTTSRGAGPREAITSSGLLFLAALAPAARARREFNRVCRCVPVRPSRRRGNCRPSGMDLSAARLGGRRRPGSRVLRFGDLVPARCSASADRIRLDGLLSRALPGFDRDEGTEFPIRGDQHRRLDRHRRWRGRCQVRKRESGTALRNPLGGWGLACFGLRPIDCPPAPDR